MEWHTMSKIIEWQHKKDINQIYTEYTTGQEQILRPDTQLYARVPL